jgi:hypothetical protein
MLPNHQDTLKMVMESAPEASGNLHIFTLLSATEKFTEFDIDIFVNCSWVDTRWQYTFTHKQYIEQHN